MPAMKSIYDAILPVITSLKEWVEKNPELTKTIIIATAAIAGIVTILGTLGLAIPVIIGGVTNFIAIIKALGIALTFLTTNPIGILITALGVLAYAVYQIYKNWDEIRPQLILVWNQIKADISSIVQGVKDAVF